MEELAFQWGRIRCGEPAICGEAEEKDKGVWTWLNALGESVKTREGVREWVERGVGV